MLRILSVSCIFTLTTALTVSAMPKMSATSGAASSAQSSAGDEIISGKILQTMNNAGYTYMQIQKKDGGKVWVAVTETAVKVGDKVAVQGGMEMRNFESKGLNRTFDSIIFSEGLATPELPKGAKSSGSSKDMKTQGSKAAVSAKDAKISVPKATGNNAYTVQEAYANSAKLNKKQVTIRGKAVKVSDAIMGKNWIHIQDGSGSQAAGDHNLVCTSASTVDVGDVITVTGTLAKDRDFGMGYKYKVIIENATIKK